MDERTRATLEERSRRYGAAAEVRAASKELGRYVGFRVADTVLGLPVALVHEFAPLRSWVPLGGVPHVLGVTQLRGEALALLDLLGALAGRSSGEGDWLVVLQGRGGRTAAVVTEVLGSRTVHEGELAPPGQVPPLCAGVTAVTRDLWHLLDGGAAIAALDAGSAAERR